MQQLFELIQLKEVKKKRGSERSSVTSEIFNIYCSPTQKKIRKIENWKRYVLWLKSHRVKDSIDQQKAFKKDTKFQAQGVSKKFIKEYTVSTIVFFLSHVKTKDLYFILSVAKDMDNRGQNFGAYLISSVTPKKLSTGKLAQVYPL